MLGLRALPRFDEGSVLAVLPPFRPLSSLHNRCRTRFNTRTAGQKASQRKKLGSALPNSLVRGPRSRSPSVTLRSQRYVVIRDTTADMMEASYDNLFPEEGWLSLRNNQPEDDGWEEVIRIPASISGQQKSHQEGVQHATTPPVIDYRYEHDISPNEVDARKYDPGCEVASNLTREALANKSAATLELLRRREAAGIARAREELRRELITVLATRLPSERV
ncbi:hypothetical protein BDZ88DRAFT_425835 [Geranomyces variabilis]|nr:hypothetical protein BDZ88DRAFT_425835 [Geranomyces variabilis]